MRFANFFIFTIFIFTQQNIAAMERTTFGRNDWLLGPRWWVAPQTLEIPEKDSDGDVKMKDCREVALERKIFQKLDKIPYILFSAMARYMSPFEDPDTF